MSQASDSSRFAPGLRGVFAATLIPTILTATALVSWITWQSLQASILRGFDEQLRAVATTTAVFIDGKDHDDILGPLPPVEGPTTPRDEDTPLYRGYVEPMQRIMDRRGLTYLYTQVLGASGGIWYVLDATRGDEHSTIGSPDQLPESQIAGAESVIDEGSVYITDVQRWDAWGLLKSAYAPIRGPSGSVVAMSGADIDIGVIEAKTRTALLLVFGAGSLALVAGALLALGLAQRMAVVLGSIKEGALRMASGEFGTHLSLPRVRELADLTAAFNHLSRSVGSTLDQLSLETASVRQRREARLLRALERPSEAITPSIPPGFTLDVASTSWTDPAAGWLPLQTPGGQEGIALWWLSEPGGDALHEASLAALVRAELGDLAQRQSAPATWQAVVEGVQRLGLQRVVVLEPSSRTGWVFGSAHAALGLGPFTWAHDEPVQIDVAPASRLIVVDDAEGQESAPIEPNGPEPSPASSSATESEPLGGADQ